MMGGLPPWPCAHMHGHALRCALVEGELTGVVVKKHIALSPGWVPRAERLRVIRRRRRRPFLSYKHFTI